MKGQAGLGLSKGRVSFVFQGLPFLAWPLGWASEMCWGAGRGRHGRTGTMYDGEKCAGLVREERDGLVCGVFVVVVVIVIAVNAVKMFGRTKATTITTIKKKGTNKPCRDQSKGGLMTAYGVAADVTEQRFDIFGSPGVSAAAALTAECIETACAAPYLHEKGARPGRTAIS